jgi:peptidyl-dipeptidase A
MWRAKYDMPPDEFTRELDRLWDQVRPLYLELHAYVRMKVRAKMRGRRAGDRSDSGPPPRQYLGAGLAEHLPACLAG